MNGQRRLICIGLMVGLLNVAVGCSAGNIVERIESEATERLDRNVDEAVENLGDSTEDGIRKVVRCVISDEVCIKRAKDQGRDVVLTDGDGNVVDEDGNVADDKRTETPGPANANYDFVAGNRSIFVEDFSADRIGDFPRRLEFMDGNLEVVEWNGGTWLRARGGSMFAISLGEQLPDRFTIEFELHEKYGITDGVAIFTTDESRLRRPYYEHNYFVIGQRHRSGVTASGRADNAPKSTSEIRTMFEGVANVEIMVDDSYAKVFIDGERVANIPNADLPRDDKLWFQISASEDGPTYIGNLRVAAGGRDLYGALERDGRVVTEGIYFDTGSDRIRPESSPAIEEIAQMLQDHPNLEVTIEGHTDSEGDDTTNQELSERRAEMVRLVLIKEHGVDGARLAAVGKGDREPVASNDTAEGRGENRRVELVRR